jgi:ubiquinone/menaquinone biosynthesis C-methylase UbiE
LIQSGLDQGSTLIDMGCGSGTFSFAIAPHCGRVIAVDVSQPMLDLVSARVTERGAGTVEAVRAGFLTYEHEGDPVDFVFSRSTRTPITSAGHPQVSTWCESTDHSAIPEGLHPAG